MIILDLKSIISELISDLIFYVISLIIENRLKKRKPYGKELDKFVMSGCDLISGKIYPKTNY